MMGRFLKLAELSTDVKKYIIVAQVCRVEEFQIEGTVKGSVVHAQRTRIINISSEGVLTASGWGMFSHSL
jgi:cytoskeletal protein CcmA (bactofilin family)